MFGFFIAQKMIDKTNRPSPDERFFIGRNMNSFHIEQTLLTHIKAWDYFDDVPLAKENRNFKPPDGIWGRVTILGGVNQVRSISDKPDIMQQGTLVIQLFCPQDLGTVAIKQKADSLAQYLKAKQLGRLELLAPSIINAGFHDYYQINVSVAWRYY